MHRKLIPMALMYAGDEEPIEGRTRLQKMVFLVQQRIESDKNTPLESDNYEFIPYDYGPFSKELYDDLDTLVDMRMVEDREEELDSGKVKYDYEIQPAGEKFIQTQLSSESEAAQEIMETARDIKSEYNDMLLSDLIDDVYSRFPEYAEESIW
jgi:uncharacterized protein YwgA